MSGSLQAMGSPRRRYQFGSLEKSHSNDSWDAEDSFLPRGIRRSSESYDNDECESIPARQVAPKKIMTKVVRSKNGEKLLSGLLAHCSWLNIKLSAGKNVKVLNLMLAFGCIVMLVHFDFKFSSTQESDSLLKIKQRTSTRQRIQVLPIQSPIPKYKRIIGINGAKQASAQTDFSSTTFPNTPSDRRRRRKKIRIPHTVDERTSRDFFPADALEKDHCKAMYPWQLTTYPSCNLIHESSRMDYESIASRHLRSINYGYFRDVWKLDHEAHDLRIGDFHINGTVSFSSPRHIVLKTLRVDQEFDAYNDDRHRRDAVAMERLTSSPHIVNIFGFCGNSQLTEYSTGGDAYDKIYSDEFRTSSSVEKLQLAYDMARGVAEVHSYGENGRASMAHTDISPSQFVYIDGIYKLNDFNRVRFITTNLKTGESCPYFVGNNPGVFRSPEEYEYGPQTEKVDVYSLGNVFYVLLTKSWPWEDLDADNSDKAAKNAVIAGKRPEIPTALKTSLDYADKVLVEAIEMCWIHDANERATAKLISDKLGEALEYLRLNPIEPKR